MEPPGASARPHCQAGLNPNTFLFCSMANTNSTIPATKDRSSPPPFRSKRCPWPRVRVPVVAFFAVEQTDRAASSREQS